MRTSQSYPSDAQIQYARDLLDKKDLLKHPGFFDRVNAMDIEEYTAYVESIKRQIPELTRSRVSEIIDSLRVLPNKPADRQPPANGTGTATDNYEDIPAGRYALHTPRATNKISFYRVDRPTEGRWAGYVFVKQQFGPHDSEPIKGRGKYLIFDEIRKAGPREAAILYGHELGRCAVCGLPLTNDESRAYGIGPVCRENTGW